ncbi:MAG TPA: protein phosphatase 2C domain-containing protein [Gemmataceae bacterium]|nr:protein phosphatase 2C domain-containing protein [Gemmataceae bacterium]
MTSNPQEQNPERPAGLQSMLDRLRGAAGPEAAAAAQPAGEEFLPAWDAPALAGAVPAEPAAEAVPVAEEAVPVAEAAEAAPAAGAAPAAPQTCPICTAVRVDGQPYCNDCGFMFPPPGSTPVEAAAVKGPVVKTVVKGRYEFGEPYSDRAGVTRHRGQDLGRPDGVPAPVVVVRMAAPKQAEPVVVEAVAVEALPVEAEPVSDDEIMPSFEEPVLTSEPVTEPIPAQPRWPSPGWERTVLEAARHPALPAVLDSFVEGDYEYLVEELPAGRTLWDAWDDPDATAEQRYGLLRQVAEALRALHQAGAMVEAIRPEQVTVTDDGRARLNDLADLLPLPVPPDAPIRGTLYTAPELMAMDGSAGPRANLYSFGALLYSLHVGRELTEMDFERPGSPRNFILRFPDIHPLFGRLMLKTFVREVDFRFPSDEASKEDATGFSELIRTLETCRRTMDNVRLEIASWTTTGIVRTGNEDAMALLHMTESRQDDLGECALIFLCDGMGGYEAGEVAAAMTIQALRKNLLQQKPFAPLAGQSPFPSELPGHEPEAPRPVDPNQVKELFRAALKDANKQVYTASRSGKGRRGMGCTAEVVYVDGRNVVVGHVGDSRTYHLHEGRLVQLTRDQTLVNRLVELGQLTAEEAENHPRKNELQQAIGGQPDVNPGLYAGVMKPGDWVVVCSDGVTNHVDNEKLREMLETESAEIAARRLVNLVNLNGATDNATVVVVRAT